MDVFWYNPDYAGEGFAYHKYADGTRVAKFFTYRETGEQRWLIAVAQPGEPVLKVWETQGGAMGSTDNPENVESVRRGDLMLAKSGDTIHMTYTFGDEVIEYDLQPLYVGGEVEPPPEPEPEPEIPPNPLEGKLTFRLKGFNWHGDWLPGNFYYNKLDNQWYVLWSTAQIHWDMLKDGRNTTLELEITAQESIEFLHTSGASGYGNPSIDGLPSTMNPGDVAVINFRLDKATKPRPFKNANFQINTSLGTIVLYTAHIMGDN